jgi:hypothetical protein
MTETQRTLFLVVCVALTAGSVATCQEKGDLLKGVTFEQSKRDIQKNKAELAVPPRPLDSDRGLPFSCDSFKDKGKQESEVYAVCLSALKENFAYEAERLRHRKWVFRFQLVASNVSFMMVVALIGFGLWFAYVQFCRDFAKTSPAINVANPPGRIEDRPTSTTDIDISLARIRISSSILGVIILGLAMGFFFLYLRFVFPIQGVQ